MHYPLTDQRLLPASMVSRYVCVLSPDQDGYLVQGTECFTMFAPCFSIDMFHTRLCTSPDLDACRAPKCFTVTRYVSQYVCFTICFTIYLFIGPDLDGYRAPQKALTLQDPQGLETTICFTLCLYISPDLDPNTKPPRHGMRRAPAWDESMNEASQHGRPPFVGSKKPCSLTPLHHDHFSACRWWIEAQARERISRPCRRTSSGEWTSIGIGRSGGLGLGGTTSGNHWIGRQNSDFPIANLPFQRNALTHSVTRKHTRTHTLT